MIQGEETQEDKEDRERTGSRILGDPPKTISLAELEA